MRKIVIASDNRNKVKEISHILSGCDCEFVTLDEAGIASDPEEDADSFEGNARIKALSAFEQSEGLAVLADDSGLIVDALDGAPGVYSSRYAGVDATDSANNALLLQNLENVAEKDRTARFVCTMLLIDETGKEHICVGNLEGKIGFEERGDGGFGYDPLFYPNEYEGKLSLAEVSGIEKDRISHRFKALEGIKSLLFAS